MKWPKSQTFFIKILTLNYFIRKKALSSIFSLDKVDNEIKKKNDELEREFKKRLRDARLISNELENLDEKSLVFI